MRRSSRGLVLAPLALGAMLAPLLLGWVSVAPNRLLSPRLAALPAGTGVMAAWAVYHAACAVLLLAALRPLRPWLAEAAAVLAALALAVTVGLGAAGLVPEGPSLARAAPAAGAWVALLLLALAAAAAAALRDGAPAVPLLAAACGIALLGAVDVLDSLSLLREAEGRKEEIGSALGGHVILSLAALALALAIAVPLALLALTRPRVESAFLGTASGLQVVPSIALFGLLIAPLAALATAFPALRAMGLGGVGPAPAVLGIAAYLLLPLGRGLLSGLRVAPPELLEAARGQGMSRGQVLRGLRVPLGAGVMLGALRLAAVQAIGLATLAALVGGGGLGTIVFQGVGQLASDLILLGVLPILALSLAADAALGGIARLFPPLS
jgi:osmoprotectant transport system permease protein